MTTKHRILVVEDEGATALDLERTLARLGHEIAGVCATGEDAVAMARELRPDLVLMDIRLAGKMDGIEATARVREDGDAAVVFLTAHGDAGTLERAKAVGPYAYVLKPFDERELQITVELALFRRETELQAQRNLEALEALVAERTAELARKTRELELATRAKSDFLRSVGHELRTPLTQIIGFAQLLTPYRDNATLEERDRYARGILDAGNRLHQLVEDVLALASFDLGRLRLARAPARVGELVRATAMMFEDAAAARETTLTVEVAKDADRVLDIDAPKVAHAMAHLLCNAVKFTPRGGRVAVRAAAEPEGAGVVITIADTGAGIAEDHLARLLRPFEKGADAPGLGVGLTLARRMLELHGAPLIVTSRVGHGSSFSFTLPGDKLGRT